MHFFGFFSCCNLIGFLMDFSKRTKTLSEPSTGKSMILDRFGASFWWLHVTHVGCWIIITELVRHEMTEIVVVCRQLK